jgi:curved DNA-binding protein CbpA
MKAKVKNQLKNGGLISLAVLVLGTIIFVIVRSFNREKGLQGLNGFFDGIDDLKTLRSVYRKLVMQYHPDKHPDANEKKIRELNEIMSLLNSEYERLSEIFIRQGKFESKNEHPTDEEKKTEQDLSVVYKEVLNRLVKYSLIQIELVGNWIWISGNTYPIRNELKVSGFMFAPVKKMWYWRPEEYKSYGKHESTNMDKIRRKYGSETINFEERNKALRGVVNQDLLNDLNALQILLQQKQDL